MNAHGPARMSAVGDGLTTFRNQSSSRDGLWWAMSGASDNVPRVKAAIDLVVDNMMEKK